MFCEVYWSMRISVDESTPIFTIFTNSLHNKTFTKKYGSNGFCEVCWSILVGSKPIFHNFYISIKEIIFVQKNYPIFFIDVCNFHASRHRLSIIGVKTYLYQFITKYIFIQEKDPKCFVRYIGPYGFL